jgi:hypothetical protein
LATNVRGSRVKFVPDRVAITAEALSGHCRHAARQCGLRAEPDDNGKRLLSRFVGVVHGDRHVHVSGANLLAALGCGD